MILVALYLFVSTGAAQTAEQRLFDALDAGKPLVAEGIVVRGAVRFDARNAGRETPLHVAIEKGYRELAELLVKKGAPLPARTLNGETPLHFSALHSDTYFVDLLLLARADPNVRNNDGESVLQWAVMSGNAMTAKHLL
jgi:ankyrin repeat protein